MDNKSFPKRILVLGKSGSGKTTVARNLSKLLNIPHLELDTIFWNPGWVKTPKDEMYKIVDEKLRTDGEWIVDGNYRFLADITWARAEMIVWLDYPLYVNLWRLFWRSLWRIVTREKVCGKNVESGRALLWPTVEYNILICCWQEARKHGEEYPKFIKEYGNGKMVILRSQRECDAWLEEFKAGMEASKSVD